MTDLEVTYTDDTNTKVHDIQFTVDSYTTYINIDEDGDVIIEIGGADTLVLQQELPQLIEALSLILEKNVER